MTKQFACCEQVTSCCKRHCCKGMSATVKGYDLVNASSLCHVFQCSVSSTEGRGIRKDEVRRFCFTTFGHPFLCFDSQGYYDRMLCLLHRWYMNNIAQVCFLNVTPCKSSHVTMSESCEATEHEGLLRLGATSVNVC